jgi:hypothetical protein
MFYSYFNKLKAESVLLRALFLFKINGRQRACYSVLSTMAKTHVTGCVRFV